MVYTVYMDRIIEIAKLRSELKTYKEIGQILGLSKQRVHQVLKQIRGDNPNRKEVLERDDHQCTICDSKEDLVVHHINGRNIENPDSFGNLATVCTKCHIKIHSADRKFLKPTEIKFFKDKKGMFKSQYRERIIEEYNKLKQVHPSHAEIAKIVGCSVATVKVFLAQYKASLRKDVPGANSSVIS